MATVLKPLYAASNALVTTNLQSLATSSSLLAGWQSGVQDNTTTLYVDVMVSAQFKTGTTVTANSTIEVWAYGILDDTPTYPDTITGSEGTVTLNSLNTKNAGLVQIAQITVDSTASRAYAMSPRGLAQYFNGHLPKKYGFYVVHNTGSALASSGNIITLADPIQYQGV
jgi:hypothetical protein